MENSSFDASKIKDVLKDIIQKHKMITGANMIKNQNTVENRQVNTVFESNNYVTSSISTSYLEEENKAFVELLRRYSEDRTTATPYTFLPYYYSDYRYMNLDQKQYYLYFRYMLRQGVAINCDNGYINMVLNDIVNLVFDSDIEASITALTVLLKATQNKMPAVAETIFKTILEFCFLHGYEKIIPNIITECEYITNPLISGDMIQNILINSDDTFRLLSANHSIEVEEIYNVVGKGIVNDITRHALIELDNYAKKQNKGNIFEFFKSESVTKTGLPLRFCRLYYKREYADIVKEKTAIEGTLIEYAMADGYFTKTTIISSHSSQEIRGKIAHEILNYLKQVFVNLGAFKRIPSLNIDMQRIICDAVSVRYDVCCNNTKLYDHSGKIKPFSLHSFAIDTSAGSYHNFLYNAKKISGLYTDEAEHVPFDGTKPTFGVLDIKTLRYYLYFRKKVLNFEYPDCSIGYAKLLAYEILNKTITLDPVQLIFLRKKYFLNGKKLEYNSFFWIIDYFLINGYDLKFCFNDKDFRKDYIKYCFLPKEEIIDIITNKQDILHLLPSSFRLKTAYLVKNKKEDIYKEIVSSCFIYSINALKKSNIEIFNQKFYPPQNRSHQIFTGALLAYGASSYRSLLLTQFNINSAYSITYDNGVMYERYYNIVTSPIFKEFADFIIKTVEDEILKFHKLKPKYNIDCYYIFNTFTADNLSPAIRRIVTAKLSDKVTLSPTKVTVDFAIINELKKQADENFAVLTSGIDDIYDKGYKEVAPLEIIEEPQATTEEDTDFYSSLSSVENETLEAIIKGNFSDITLKSKGLMASVIIDGINEKAMDFFGDILIYSQDNIYKIQEDLL